jgi:hypothetical protein
MKNPKISSALIAVLISLSNQAQSQAQLTDDEKKTVKAAQEIQDRAEGVNDQEVLKKYFGAGLMANFDVLNIKSKRVKSARVVGGVVRVDEESRGQLGFMLEAHKFISSSGTGASKVVSGPYIGMVMGGDSSIDTGILGYMWGFRQPATTQTLNIGIGLSVTPRAQVLGDGIEEGAALPNGETEVRYKTKTKYGLAITVSFGF